MIPTRLSGTRLSQERKSVEAWTYQVDARVERNARPLWSTCRWRARGSAATRGKRRSSACSRGLLLRQEECQVTVFSPLQAVLAHGEDAVAFHCRAKTRSATVSWSWGRDAEKCEKRISNESSYSVLRCMRSAPSQTGTLGRRAEGVALFNELSRLPCYDHGASLSTPETIRPELVRAKRSRRPAQESDAPLRALDRSLAATLSHPSSHKNQRAASAVQ